MKTDRILSLFSYDLLHSLLAFQGAGVLEESVVSGDTGRTVGKLLDLAGQLLHRLYGQRHLARVVGRRLVENFRPGQTKLYNRL